MNSALLSPGLIILAGIFATSVMTVFLYALHTRRLANGDMVNAIGSLFTRSEHNSFLVGIVVHYAMGIAFAFLYATLLRLLNLSNPSWLIIACASFGFCHGVATNIGLVYFVAIHHPLPRFQQPGISVAVSHWAAHIVYGLVLGAVFAAGIQSHLTSAN